MKLRNKILGLLIAIMMLGVIPETKAQDPNYSQFFSNSLYYNPAYTGISQGFNARFDYRKQWPNLRNDFKTYNFNTDISIREFPGSGGVGLIFNKDKSGSGNMETVNAGFLTSVRIRLAQNVLTQVGVMASYYQKYIDWDRLVFTDELDPRYGQMYESAFIPSANDRVSYPDFSAGALVRFVQTTVNNTNIVGTMGLAVHHLFEPNESFFEQASVLPRKIVVHADMIFEREGYSRQIGRSQGGNDFSSQKFNPGVYFVQQGPFQTFGMGINLYYKTLYGGIWYRNTEIEFSNTEASVILMLGINAQFNESSRLKILYSYDLGLNDYLARSGGAHEISLLIGLDDFSLFSPNKRYFGRGVKSSSGQTVYQPLECSPF